MPTECAAGTIAPFERMEACDKCPAGEYQDDGGATACKACLPGSYCPQGAAAAFFAALAAAVQKKRAEWPNRDLVVSHALFKNAHRQAVLDAFPHETELIYLNVPTSLLGERLWARFKASGYSDEEILPTGARPLGGRGARSPAGRHHQRDPAGTLRGAVDARLGGTRGEQTAESSKGCGSHRGDGAGRSDDAGVEDGLEGKVR